jgi:hypothetical protein
MYTLSFGLDGGSQPVSKYEPLGEFLRSRRADEVPMTFSEIERIIGAKLPRSAEYRAWWSNNDFNSVMTKVWRQAGFESTKVDMAARKLIFRRVSTAETQKEAVSLRHPLFGALKGLSRVASGVDLTKPADPTWGRETSGQER